MRKRSLQNNPRGGKRTQRKIRQEQAILQAAIQQGLTVTIPHPVYEVEESDSEVEVTGESIAVGDSGTPSVAAETFRQPPNNLRIVDTVSLDQFPAQDFAIHPLSTILPTAAPEDKFITRVDEEYGEGLVFPTAVAVDFYNTLAITERNAYKKGLGKGVPATKGLVVPTEHLAWLNRVYSTGAGAVLVTYVGRNSASNYVNSLIESGIPKIFSATVVVTRKAGPRGKSAVCQALEIPCIIDDNEEVINDCWSKGIWCYQVTQEYPLTAVPHDRLLE